MKGKIGIWIDKRRAKLLSINGENTEFKSLESEIEEFRPKGGSGSRQKGGPQDVVQDSKYMEREKDQHKDFFEKIINHLKDAEAIVIFGPAQTGEKLHKEISESYQQLQKKLTSVEKTDAMTDNQVKAWVKDYYSN